MSRRTRDACFKDTIERLARAHRGETEIGTKRRKGTTRFPTAGEHRFEISDNVTNFVIDV